MGEGGNVAFRGEFRPIPDPEGALPGFSMVGVEITAGGMEAGEGGLMDREEGFREDGRNDMIPWSTSGPVFDQTSIGRGR